MISVGGFGVVLSGEGSNRIPEALIPFQSQQSEPGLQCSGAIGPLGPPDPSRTLFDSGGTWQVDDAGAGRIDLVLRHMADPARAYHRLRLSDDLLRAEARLDPRKLTDAARLFPLREPMLELWLTFCLMRGVGVLVHGCGLELDGRVRMFVGESGAGKSTMARILSQHGAGRILSDDRLIVRPEGTGYRVYGTPWHGEARFAEAGDGLLESICFLQHGSENRLESVSAAEAASRLAAVFFMACWPRDRIGQILDYGVRLASAVPCQRLCFVPDESVIPILGLP